MVNFKDVGKHPLTNVLLPTVEGRFPVTSSESVLTDSAALAKNVPQEGAALESLRTGPKPCIDKELFLLQYFTRFTHTFPINI